jgi:hypothetical protein
MVKSYWLQYFSWTRLILLLVASNYLVFLQLNCYSIKLVLLFCLLKFVLSFFCFIKNLIECVSHSSLSFGCSNDFRINERIISWLNFDRLKLFRFVPLRVKKKFFFAVLPNFDFFSQKNKRIFQDNFFQMCVLRSYFPCSAIQIFSFERKFQHFFPSLKIVQVKYYFFWAKICEISVSNCWSANFWITSYRVSQYEKKKEKLFYYYFLLTGTKHRQMDWKILPKTV